MTTTTVSILTRPRPQIIVPRDKIRDVLENDVLGSPWRILSAYVCRRTPLMLRYPPIDAMTQGPLARVGDERISDTLIRDANGKIYDVTTKAACRRKGDKIILQDVGTWRWVHVKNYDHDDVKASKHWTPTEGGKLWFDPAEKDLILLRGMYNDSVKTHTLEVDDNDFADVKMQGRYGQWRPWTMLCLRSVTTIRALGNDYIVPDPILPDSPSVN